MAAVVVKDCGEREDETERRKLETAEERREGIRGRKKEAKGSCWAERKGGRRLRCGRGDGAGRCEDLGVGEAKV